MPAQGRGMDRRPVIVVQRDVHVELPVSPDRLLHVKRPSRNLRHGFDDREGVSQILLERLCRPIARKSSKDERSTGSQFDRLETRCYLVRRLAIGKIADGNANGPAVTVVLPVMKSAHDRAVTPALAAKRIGAMGAKVLEATQFRAEALDEDGPRGDGGAKPVPVAGDVPGQPQESPDTGQPALLFAEGFRIDQLLRPVCREFRHAIWRRSFAGRAATEPGRARQRTTVPAGWPAVPRQWHRARRSFGLTCAGW